MKRYAPDGTLVEADYWFRVCYDCKELENVRQRFVLRRCGYGTSFERRAGFIPAQRYEFAKKLISKWIEKLGIPRENERLFSVDQTEEKIESVNEVSQGGFDTPCRDDERNEYSGY
jgi:hypothetical protein